MPLRFFITDVFCQQKYAGNQLATFLGCGELPGTEMQKMAREINFSETTFILSDQPRNGGYDVRIFTPGKEVDFAGHPTLGTAFIIQKYIIGQQADRVILNLKAGQIPVRFENGAGDAGALWMDQVPPSFGDTLEPQFIAALLKLPLEAIDERFPAQAVSTGLPHIIVPLKNLSFLQKAALSKDIYSEYCKSSAARCVLIFSPEAYNASHDVSVRMFADYLGIAEDPATGSGCGCLAAYLSRHNYFGTSDISIRAGQGYEIGRPSLLHLKAGTDRGMIRISVGGMVVQIAEGQWL